MHLFMCNNLERNRWNIYWCSLNFTPNLSSNPSIIVGFTTFEHLKAWFAHRFKEKNTCYCKYHAMMEKLCKGFNNMRMKGKGVHVFCVYTCDICGFESECEAHLHTFDRLTPLWKSILCPKVRLQEWHDLGCLYNDFLNCGIQNLKVCP